MLNAKKYWMFDMDGTLTHAIHDFDAIREALGLPYGTPILEAIDELPADKAAETHKDLNAMEYKIAEDATAQPGAIELLQLLVDREVQIGIVTRNGKGIAKATLRAAGLAEFFTDEFIISRDCCAPKPNPDGVELLLQRFSGKSEHAVMVGDYLFDLQAGKTAGTTTVHMDVHAKYTWPEFTDVGVQSLPELHALIA